MSKTPQTQSPPVDTVSLDNLRWAEPALGVEPPVPLSKLLQALQLLASDEARTQAAGLSNWDDPTPASLQVIKSGTLAITKRGTKLVAGVGGGASALSAIAAAVSAFRDDVGSDVVTATLIGSAAILLSAVSIALAMFVKGDLEARGRATAARHQGRADVAASFLQATAQLVKPAEGTSTTDTATLVAILMSAADGLEVSTSSYPGTPFGVDALRQGVGENKPVELRLANGDWVPMSVVTGFVFQPRASSRQAGTSGVSSSRPRGEA